MLTDRYGLALSTSDTAARDAYVEGVDLLLTVYPGAAASFDRAIAAAIARRISPSPDWVEDIEPLASTTPAVPEGARWCRMCCSHA